MAYDYDIRRDDPSIPREPVSGYGEANRIAHHQALALASDGGAYVPPPSAEGGEPSALAMSARNLADAMRVIDGVASVPPTPKRMPIKTRRVPLEDDYAGWWVDIRTNAPLAAFLQLTKLGEADGTAAFDAMLGILPRLVRDWNVCDEAGRPLPCDQEGFVQLPGDLIMQIIKLAGGALTASSAVPKALDGNSGPT